ncbi:conserved hypothetical protein [Gammaproteobacteria bacterium]
MGETMPSVRQRLFDHLDSLPAGYLSGWELFEDMAKLTGRKTYPATLLEYARDYAALSGAVFRCIDAEKSLYHYVPGVSLEGAIID